ncbi:MAG: exonuclease domain-containing protein [Lachnospiraceae bacterium]|nr:exonuclease domain-containing protein [Lachnospiraceae bacterium]
MNYIVLDLEWNQGESGPVAPDNDIPFEIIEIGAVKLNSDRVMIDEFSELIKPQVYKTMHYVTGKLIHLKMQELSFERPFDEVVKNFLDWCGEDYVFCTWGPLDLFELQRNMAHYNIEAFSDRPLAFYDVQKLFALEYDEDKKRRALESAVDFLEIDKDIPFHRAFSDAYYTAKVFSRIHRSETLRHYSYDLFTPPIDKEHEIYSFFGDYDKYISRLFPSKDALLADKDIKRNVCYLCNKASKRVVHPFSPSGKFYLSVSLCETHGYVKSKIRIKKTDDDKYFCVRTRKIVTEDVVEDIKKRYNKLKELKKPVNPAKGPKTSKRKKKDDIIV